jgi:hypothetical protein
MIILTVFSAFCPDIFWIKSLPRVTLSHSANSCAERDRQSRQNTCPYLHSNMGKALSAHPRRTSFASGRLFI